MTSIETDLEGAINNLNTNLNYTIDQLAPVKMFPGLVLSWGNSSTSVMPPIDVTSVLGGRRFLMNFFGSAMRSTCVLLRARFLSANHLSDALDYNKDIGKGLRNLGLLPKRKEEGFSFKPVTINDVVLAISHFSSQARGTDGVPKSVIVKALPVIGN